MSQHLDPTPIMQTATAFWPSKVLLTAVGFDLFSMRRSPTNRRTAQAYSSASSSRMRRSRFAARRTPSTSSGCMPSHSTPM